MPKRRRFGPVLIPGSPTTPPPSSDEEEEEEEGVTEPTRTPMDVSGCAPCDEEETAQDAAAIPANARMPAGRTLRPCVGQEGVYEDVEDGQKFRLHKVNGGATRRFVPIFIPRIQWNTARGFKAMLLILSCLGDEGEYVVVNDKETKEPMDVYEWKRRKYGARDKVLVWHKGCNEVVDSTKIHNLQKGGSIGCSCHGTSAPANLWKNRRDEVVQKGKERGFLVVTTEEEWRLECTGYEWCPKLQCIQCNEVVDSTNLNSLQQGHIGCSCHGTSVPANLWKNRRDEAVESGKERGFLVLTTEEEWRKECTGAFWCPKLQCTECGCEVDSTQIHSLQKGQGIGCNGCRNKTEKKLKDWLVANVNSNHFDVVHGTFRGPGHGIYATHFDFLLRSKIDDYRVIIELDGRQHFWEHVPTFTEAGCKRDLQKEKFANKRDICVIRLLQDDVYRDKNDWDAWLKYLLFETHRVWTSDGVARVFCAPEDAPEYTTDPTSAYVRHHQK